MIIWFTVLMSCPVAHATRVITDVELVVADDDGDGDPTPPRPRSRGPPLTRRSGHRTARLAGNGTCPIHDDPVPSAHHPGWRSPEHQLISAPNASPSANRRCDQPTEIPDRVEQLQATPTPAGFNRNGWPVSSGTGGRIRRNAHTTNLILLSSLVSPAE